MNATKTILSLATLTTLTAALSAQGTFNLANLGNLSGATMTYVLPASQSRFGSYDAGIGNSWLGGSVSAYAGIVRQKEGTYELGNANLGLRATGSLLRFSAEVAEVVGNFTNIMNNGVQRRDGYFRVEVLSVPVVNRSFTSSSTFAQQNWTFNLFPNGVSADVPVGPVSISLRGNAGCGLGMSANYLLPAATASVGANASANAYAFADARVGVGIPGFGLGCGIEGRICDQRLSIGVNASAASGLSGSATYSLTPITLRLYAWAQAIRTWTTTLTSWSSAAITRTFC